MNVTTFQDPLAAVVAAVRSCPRPVRLLLAALFALVPFGTASAAQFHTVQPGDTLSAIADSYDVPMAEIVALNGLSDPNHIVVGSTLTLEGPPAVGAATYTVQPGDSLSGIATQFRVLVRDLVEVNDIRDPDHIQTGWALTIPGATVQVAAFEVSYDTAVDALQQAEYEYGLPQGILLALAWQESGFQQGIVSEAGAIGLTQVLPSTADWALDWLIPDAHNWVSDPYDNARMGAAILRHWYNLANGDIEMALAAYYQGWHGVETQGMFQETKQYIANVLALVPRFV